MPVPARTRLTVIVALSPLLLFACSGTSTPGTTPADGGDGASSSSVICDAPTPLCIGGVPGCTYNFRNCTDGHLYRVNCPGGSPRQPCDCIVDNAAVRSVDAYDACNAYTPADWTADIDRDCGWTLQPR